MTAPLTISQLTFVHTMMLVLDDIPDAALGKLQARFAAYSGAGLVPVLGILPHDVFHAYDEQAAHLEKTRRWVLTMKEAA